MNVSIPTAIMSDQASGRTAPKRRFGFFTALPGLLIMAAIAPLQACCAEPVRPPAGQTVDETRTVQLRTSRSSPCISIAAGRATIILVKSEIESLAAQRPQTWTTEEERIALIAGKRAEDLLSGLAATTGDDGCFIAPRAILSGDAAWLVLRQLELGMAAVKLMESSRFAPVVSIRYTGKREGSFGIGHITADLPESGENLLFLQWWRS